MCFKLTEINFNSSSDYFESPFHGLKLATKVAASEYTLNTANPSKNVLEGLMGSLETLVFPKGVKRQL